MTKRNQNKPLINEINPVVSKNQQEPIGHRIIFTYDGLKHEVYFDEDVFIVERLEKRMRAECGWFERISSHKPSIGSFYESLMQNAIKEVLPSSIKLGSGFVYNSDTRTASPQIDFILYNDQFQSPIYSNDNFIVVDKANVISCVEIKKTLNSSILKKVLSTYLNVNLGSSPRSYRGVQFLNIFVFKSSMSTLSIYKLAVSYLQDFFRNFRSEGSNGDINHFVAYHLVLPNIYFFDRTGFIESTIKVNLEDNSFKIHLSFNRSAYEGHSLGEFLTRVISVQHMHNEKFKNNFLDYPFIQQEEDVVVCEKINLMRKLSMNDIISHFPDEVEILKKDSLSKDYLRYGALVSSAINLEKVSLREIEKTPSFKWLIKHIE